MRSVIDPARRPVSDETGSGGCFETMRAYGGRIFRLEAHLDRLEASAACLGLRAPRNRRQVRQRLVEALRRSGLRDAVVRLALFPEPSGPAAAGLVVRRLERPPPAAYRSGIRVATVPARSFPVGAIDPKAKYSARLGSILAVLDAKLRGADEALFMDVRGYVTESTASNVAIIRHGVLQTPPCWLGALLGITRDVLIEVARRLGLPVQEVPLTRHDLYNAREAFLSSTIKEVLPIVVIDGRRIGTGRPGPVTRRLHRAFHEVILAECRGADRHRGRPGATLRLEPRPWPGALAQDSARRAWK